MRIFATIFAAVLFGATAITDNRTTNLGPDQDTCLMLSSALSDYQKIKTGDTRREVAKYFVPDGGIQFAVKTRYVYSKCSYLHIDVEFELAKPGEVSSEPADKVISISHLYVEYSAKD